MYSQHPKPPKKKLPEGYFRCEHCKTIIGPAEDDCPTCAKDPSWYQ